jgi:hypothetical protein
MKNEFENAECEMNAAPFLPPAPSKVYLTMLPQRKVQNGERYEYVPMFNITPAREFGEIVELFPFKANYLDGRAAARTCREKLKNYNYAAGDAVLLLGDTVIMACVIAVLAADHGRFHVLKWDRNLGRYVRIAIDLQNARGESRLRREKSARIVGEHFARIMSAGK